MDQLVVQLELQLEQELEVVLATVHHRRDSRRVAAAALHRVSKWRTR